MFSVQPSQLTDRELARYADDLLAAGKLPVEWQEELLKRFENLIYQVRENDWR
jgi:hypothetical protein